MISVVDFRAVKEHWNQAAQQWDDPRYVYIGRENKLYGLPDSKWRNPFRLKHESLRRQVLDDYRKYITGNGWLLMQVDELRGKTLVCWCAPRACHGHILAELASLSDGDLFVRCEIAGIKSGASADALEYCDRPRMSKKERAKWLEDLQSEEPAPVPVQLWLF